MRELLFVPDISVNTDPAALEISRILQEDLPMHFTGTLVAPDESFLLTVDWDSFFTVLFGSAELIAHLTVREHVEGFRATPNTEHFWFLPLSN